MRQAHRSRGDATRERLLGAAVELLEEGGYAAASVAAIAERGGVSAGALYRHFPSKAELFVEVFRTVAERKLAELYEASSVQGAVVDKLEAVIGEFTRNSLDKPRLAWALGYEPVDPLVDAERLAYRQTYRERLADLLRRGIASGELPEQDAELTAASLIGAISEALVSPLSPVRDESVSAEEIVGALSSFCRRAIGA
jgi:AcrR family transcriptional regulator